MIAKMKNKKKGFTLVELIVVLLILAILIALLVPALTGYIERAKEREIAITGRQLKNAVQTIGTEFYDENKGTWSTWSSENTSYNGYSGTNGNGKLRLFIADCLTLAEETSVTNYLDTGNSENQFFCANLTKKGKVQHMFYVDGLRYVYIGENKTVKTGKMNATGEEYDTWVQLTEMDLQKNYGRNAITARQSYVYIS